MSLMKCTRCGPSVCARPDPPTSEGDRRVLVDLSGLEFMDSNGLHILVSAQQRAVQNGQRLALLRGPRPVHRLFDVTQTAALFQFED